MRAVAADHELRVDELLASAGVRGLVEQVVCIVACEIAPVQAIGGSFFADSMRVALRWRGFVFVETP